MRPFLLAAGVGLAAFAAVAAGLAVAALLAARRLPDDHPVAASRRLFLLRVLPTCLGLVAAALAVRAFLLLEPREVDETPGLTFLLLAAAGGAALTAGLWRAATDLLITRRMRREWLRQGRPVALEGAPAPAVRMAHPFPVICVVGVIRPRIFVADAVLQGLSASEISAVLAHERAHVSAADNLRRVVMRLCPPLPWPSLARRLEQRWQDMSEEAADVRANAGLDLASALVSTARLAPPGARLQLGAAAFHSGGALARRVRRLCEPSPSPAVRPRRGWALPLAAAVAMAGLTAWPHVVSPVHRLLEALVHLP